HYTHDPLDSSSLSTNDIILAREDRSGTFWVADGGNLEQLDRATGKVIWRFSSAQSVRESFGFHEDRSGKLWMAYSAAGGTGGIAALDRNRKELTYYSFYDRTSGEALPRGVSAMLEDNEGILWVATRHSGLLKFDQHTGTVIRYRHYHDDPDSLDDDRVLSLSQDREGNIWVGLHAREPVLFATRKASFTSLLRGRLARNFLGEKMVNAIYEDHEGTIWVGVTRSLIRIDRKTGQYDSYDLPETGLNNDLVSIVEDSSGVIWAGTEGAGLYRFDAKAGR